MPHHYVVTAISDNEETLSYDVLFYASSGNNILHYFPT